MEEKVKEFKEYWNNHNSYISLELSDKEIKKFIKRFPKIEKAVDMAVDYQLSNGIGEVEP